MSEPQPTNDDERAAEQQLAAALTARQRAIRMGAVAAVLSAALAVMANLSEIAGWFTPDETRVIVEQARETIVDTDAKVEELLILLRNQAAASGIDLNIESEVAIRNAVSAIIASGDAQKRAAIAQLESGDVAGAATTMSQVASEQASAVAQTRDVAAATWCEAGALYQTYDFDKAIDAYRTAASLLPDDTATLERLGRIYVRAGRLNEAKPVFEQVLERARDASVRSAACNGLGQIARQQGEYIAAEDHLKQALEVADAADAKEARVFALNALGQLERARGNRDEARAYLDRALVLADTLDDELLRADILLNQGIIAAEQEKYEEATRLMREVLAIQERGNDRASQALTLGKLGAVALLQNDLESARELLLRTVDLKQQMRWDASVIYDLINLGTLAARKEEYDTADGYFVRAEAIAAEHDLLEIAPVITFNRGELAFNRGDIESACRFFAEAAPRLEAMGSQYTERVKARYDENCR